MTITEPGIYPGITDTEYHADPVVGGSLTSTGARTLINRTPAHYRHEQKQGRPDKAAFDLGRAVHDALLGHGAPLHEVPADDWRTKAAKEARDWAREQGYTPLLTPQIEAVRARTKLAVLPLRTPILEQTEREMAEYFAGTRPSKRCGGSTR